MKQIVFIIIIFCNFCAYSQVNTINPIVRSVGNLKISIDPRMELLNAAQLLSNTPYIDKQKVFSQEAITYFKPFSSEKVVALTDELIQGDYSFGLDAPPEFMLHLSQVPELEQQTPFTERLLERGGGAENLEKYRIALKQFAEVSNFENFWNSKIPLYNQILDLTIAEMGEMDLVKVLENYYNETHASYNIILSPAFSGGYGPRIPNENGKLDIYACITTYFEKEGVPYMDMVNLRDYVWHEWGHPFVNPLTEKYRDRVNASGKLQEPIAKKIAGEYSHWWMNVNEHIIRAIHVRLLELYADTQQAKQMLDYELKKRFIYVIPLIEKLKDFEKQRDERGITFSEFYPQLLNLFENLLEMEYWKQVDMNFKGPIVEVYNEPRRAFIYPTQDTNAESLKTIQDYAAKIFNMSQLRNGLLLADTTALKTDLSDYGISAYGTIESNLFLKQYAHLLPFKIENETIYADKEYTDPNLRLMFCVPNPQNSETGMIVFTAISNNAYQNPVRISMDSDYLLFLDGENILSKGFFKKDGKWKL